MSKKLLQNKCFEDCCHSLDFLLTFLQTKTLENFYKKALETIFIFKSVFYIHDAHASVAR